MRCILEFDENKDLIEQNVAAYSAMQPLSEPPVYKEEDIKDPKSKEFFRGYKFAIDDVCRTIENMVFDGELKKKKMLMIEDYMQGDIVMLLWSILDGEYVGEDNEKC